MLNRKLLTLALVLPILSTNAQNYVPIIINGEVFFKTELETAQGLVLAEVTVANFEDVGGQLYNRVFFNRNNQGDMLVGYLREDPAAGQLYFRTSAAAADVLVYDISLEPGETVTLSARWCDGLPGDVATVVAADTVDGRRRVTFNRQVGNNDICEPLTFLEGVGPNASVIFPYFRNAVPQNGVAMRLCHASREAIIFYPTGQGADFCGIDITDEESPTLLSDVRVFPNPFTDGLHVTTTAPVRMATLFGASGQRLLTTIDPSHIDTQSLPPGLYVLQIALEDGTTGVWKVVKI